MKTSTELCSTESFILLASVAAETVNAGVNGSVFQNAINFNFVLLGITPVNCSKAYRL